MYCSGTHPDVQVKTGAADTLVGMLNNPPTPVERTRVSALGLPADRVGYPAGLVQFGGVA